MLQAPIKRLTDTCCSSIDGALNPQAETQVASPLHRFSANATRPASQRDSLQVLQALQAELASTRLTTSNVWLQASLVFV